MRMKSALIAGSFLALALMTAEASAQFRGGNVRGAGVGAFNRGGVAAFNRGAPRINRGFAGRAGFVRGGRVGGWGRGAGFGLGAGLALGVLGVLMAPPVVIEE